jgi:hypothetical protein
MDIEYAALIQVVPNEGSVDIFQKNQPNRLSVRTTNSIAIATLVSDYLDYLNQL